MLKANLEKRELILIGSVDQVKEMASVLGYRIGSLPSTYLELRLRASFNLVSIWN